MPQTEEHALLVELFHRHPELAAWLAELSGRVRLPFVYSARNIDPAHHALDLSADAVALITDEAGRTELALPVEIQRGPDPVKDYTWPVYGWLERARQRCPSYVLVLATRPGVARWARQFSRGGPDDPVQVIPLDPLLVPRITDVTLACADPPRAILSAALHAGRKDGALVMRAAATALLTLPPTDAWLYSRLVFHSLSRLEIANLLKDIMQEHEIPQDDNYAVGWKEYVRELQAVGAAEASAKAAVKIRAEILLQQLRQRGFRITASARTRIQASTDAAELDLWLTRVLTIQRLPELFA